MSTGANTNLYEALQQLSSPALKLASYSAALYVTAFMLGWVYLFGYFRVMGADWALGTVPVTSVAIEALLPCYAVLATCGILAYLIQTEWFGWHIIRAMHYVAFGACVGTMIGQLILALNYPSTFRGLPFVSKAALAVYVATSIMRSAMNIRERRTEKSHEIGYWLGVMIPVILPAALFALGSIQGKVDSNPHMSQLVRVVQPNNNQPCEWVLVKPITGERMILAHLRWPLPPTLMIAPADRVMISNIPGCLTENWGREYFKTTHVTDEDKYSGASVNEPESMKKSASQNNSSDKTKQR